MKIIKVLTCKILLLIPENKLNVINIIPVIKSIIKQLITNVKFYLLYFSLKFRLAFIKSRLCTFYVKFYS